jgi:hypothetical protein
LISPAFPVFYIKKIASVSPFIGKVFALITAPNRKNTIKNQRGPLKKYKSAAVLDPNTRQDFLYTVIFVEIFIYTNSVNISYVKLLKVYFFVNGQSHKIIRKLELF